MLNLESPLTQFALNAVRQATLLVKQVQAEMVSPALTKGDRSPVTVADFAAQALVGSLLAETYPGDPLVGEEDAAALRTPDARPSLERVTHFVRRFVPQATPESVCDWIDRGNADPWSESAHSSGEHAPVSHFWTLDPIDGTKGFLRGDKYAVALALITDGQVEIGVVGCPNLTLEGVQGSDILVFAVRNGGTYVTPLQGEPQFTQLHVSKRFAPSQARLLRSFESGHTNTSKIDLFAQALGVDVEPVRMDSQAKYAIMAAGHGELYLRLLSDSKPDYREKIWDQAAGSILVEEAGGRVSDLHGKPLDFTAGRTLANNRGICVSNGLLHNHALQALRKVDA